MRSILVAYDKKILWVFLVIILEEEGCHVVNTSSVEKATKLILKNDFDLILTEILMGRSSGIYILDAVRNALPDNPVVIIAYSSAKTTVTDMKEGPMITFPIFSKLKILNR